MTFHSPSHILIKWAQFLTWKKFHKITWHTMFLRERHSLCRYLFFYSETIELLLRSGVLSPDQTGLPVVSEAISGLWSSLPPERREEAQQRALDQRSASWESQTEISASHLTSLDPSASYTVEEVRIDTANMGVFWKSFALPLNFQFPALVTNGYWWPSVSQATVHSLFFQTPEPDFL